MAFFMLVVLDRPVNLCQPLLHIGHAHARMGCIATGILAGPERIGRTEIRGGKAHPIAFEGYGDPHQGGVAMPQDIAENLALYRKQVL